MPCILDSFVLSYTRSEEGAIRKIEFLICDQFVHDIFYESAIRNDLQTSAVYTPTQSWVNPHHRRRNLRVMFKRSWILCVNI